MSVTETNNAVLEVAIKKAIEQTQANAAREAKTERETLLQTSAGRARLKFDETSEQLNALIARATEVKSQLIQLGKDILNPRIENVDELFKQLALLETEAQLLPSKLRRAALLKSEAFLLWQQELTLPLEKLATKAHDEFTKANAAFKTAQEALEQATAALQQADGKLLSQQRAVGGAHDALATLRVKPIYEL